MVARQHVGGVDGGGGGACRAGGGRWRPRTTSPPHRTGAEQNSEGAGSREVNIVEVEQLL